jgi:hypothetical protein
LSVDTLEWGSVEPARRRLPALRFFVPRVGVLGLAAGGFAALVAAELLPWGIVQMPASAANTVRPPQSLLTNGAEIGLLQINSGDVLVYRLATLFVLGVLGFGLAGSVARRRAALGGALGAVAGLALSVLAVYRTTLHFFDGDFGRFGYGGGPANSDYPTVLTGAGSYFAFLAVGLLAAAAIAAGAGQRDWWRSRSAGESGAGTRPVPAARGEADAEETDRELTVSGLEPLDERYFARPDTR